MDHFTECLSHGARAAAALLVEQPRFDPPQTGLPQQTQWNAGIRFESLANLAHELRTPVQVLLGYLDILRDESSSSRGDGAAESAESSILERMNANVHELAQTVENVLEYALGHANAQPAIAEEIDLADFFAELEEILNASAHRPELAVTMIVENVSTIVTRRRALRSIVLNLASNAIKFTAEGAVTINASRGTGSASNLHIEIRDTGVGISEDLLSTAFEPLVQLSRSSIRRHRGLGLGLTLVRRNLKTLGGSLRVESVLGAGSCFKVTIPCSGPCSGSESPMCTSSQSSDNNAC